MKSLVCWFVGLLVGCSSIFSMTDRQDSIEFHHLDLDGRAAKLKGMPAGQRNQSRN